MQGDAVKKMELQIEKCQLRVGGTKIFSTWVSG